MPLESSNSTEFMYFPVLFYIKQNNPDGGKVLPTRVVSATSGPFDFSDAAVPAAVTLQIRTGTGSWVNDTVDLSGVAAIGAVTVAELVTAITTAAVTNLTASAEAGTGKLKLELATPGSARWLQVRGEVATYTGMTALILPGDTHKSIAIAPIFQEGEDLQTIGAVGKIVTVGPDTLRLGSNITITDRAYSDTLLSFIEGGTFVDNGFTERGYNPPGQNDPQPIFTVGAVYGMYHKGSNRQTAPVKYKWFEYPSCTGRRGDIAGDRNAQDITYTIKANQYVDPITGAVDDTDEYGQSLSLTEFANLNFLAL